MATPKSKDVPEALAIPPQEPESSPQEAAPQPPEPLIYVGPSIPGLTENGQVFLSLPNQMEEHIKQCPAIRALLIPPERYAKERSSDAVRICSRRVTDYLRR